MKKLFPLALAIACPVMAAPGAIQAQDAGDPGPGYDCQVLQPDWYLYVNCVESHVLGNHWPYNCGAWRIQDPNSGSFVPHYVASCNVLDPLITPGEAESSCNGDLLDESEYLEYWVCLQEKLDDGLSCTVYTRWYDGEETICALCARKDPPGGA